MWVGGAEREKRGGQAEDILRDGNERYMEDMRKTGQFDHSHTVRDYSTG